MRAENVLDRLRLGGIPDLGGGAVGIDIAHLLGREVRLVQSLTHGAGLAVG